MKLETVSLSNAFKPIVSFFVRFHTLLFFLVVSVGLFIAIMFLLSVIELSSSTAMSSDEAISRSFDETTIKRLETGSVPTQPTPGQRISPFIE